jgi:hypothetical protein
VRDSIKGSYIRAEKSIFDKKERLFRGKDPYKWGGFTDNLQI